MVKVRRDKILRDLYILRLDDDEVRFFEGIWKIPEGITYNSYILDTGEGFIVFDTWKRKYSNLFISSLSEIIDLKDIKYVVIHHMEPDHSGSLPELINSIGKDKVVLLGHPMTGSMLKSFYGISGVKFNSVKDLDSVKLGIYTIKFIHTPWIHWPETIMSYVDDTGVLLSCDAFGSYSIPRSITDNDANINEYLNHVRKYLVTIVGFYREFIAKAISKVKSLNIKINVIAPSHGLVIMKHVSDIVNYYYNASLGRVTEKGKVTLVYSSMYGFIEEIMDSIENELSRSGLKVVKHSFTDTYHSSIGNVLSDLFDSELIILGISAYEGGVFPIINYLLELVGKKVRLPKKTIAYISYGWGISSTAIAKLIKDAGLELIDVVSNRGRGSKETASKIVDLVLKSLSKA